MSVTPERLRDIAEGLEISADCKATCDIVTGAELDIATVQREICSALYEYADALEKCEPVYQLEQINGARQDVTKELYDGANFRRILYAAPQAVKVPDNEFVRLFNDLVQHEREACAAICDELHWAWKWDDEEDSDSGPRACAAAIRARSE